MSLKRLLVVFFILLATVALIQSYMPAAVHAASSISEIRNAILKYSLNTPPNEFFSDLTFQNLNEKLNSFDKYARYEPPPELIKPIVDKYLGIDIFQHKKEAYVAADPYGSAFRAGVPEIGKLVAVNSFQAKDSPIDKISEQIDISMKSSNVILTVADDTGNIKKIELPAAINKPPSIFWRKIDRYLIIIVKEFVSHETAIKMMAIWKTKANENTRLIIDLRRCPGGDLFEAIESAGLFIQPLQKLSFTKDRSSKDREYFSSKTKKISRKPWILVDGTTASAAEIFSGILKYHSSAVLVGEKTFGKCVSQTPIPLSDGASLWLTNLSVYFPDKTSCNENGIKPSIFLQNITIKELSEITSIINDYSGHDQRIINTSH